MNLAVNYRRASLGQRNFVMGGTACLLGLLFCSLVQAAPPEMSRAQLIRVLNSPNETVARRVQALQALSRMAPLPAATLVKTMQESPAGLQLALALQLAQDESGSEALLASVLAGKCSARLLEQESIMTRLQKLASKEEQQTLENLLDNVSSVDEEIITMIAQRRKGFLAAKADAKRGQAVFEKNCVACHRVKKDGGKIGPDLKWVGRRGLDRMLEDVLDPHRNVDPAFRRTTVVTTEGGILSGLLVPGKGTQRLLMDQQGKEIVLDQSKIEEAIISPLSAMPTGLAGHLPTSEFYDLVRYLLTLQGSPAKSNSALPK